jgi:hypothetical protein
MHCRVVLVVRKHGHVPYGMLRSRGHRICESIPRKAQHVHDSVVPQRSSALKADELQWRHRSVLSLNPVEQSAS